MFRHRKLVVVLMRDIDITILMPDDPHFSFDRTVPLPILSERWKLKKKCFFFHHHAVENFDHRSHLVLAKKEKVFGRFLAWKEVLDYNNLLNGSIQIEFHHSVVLPVVERLNFSPKVNETTAISTVYDTAYLQNERGDPQLFLYFWHKVPII